MRAALPIFWCLTPEAKGILASMISGLSAIPAPDWVDWETGKPLKSYRIPKDIPLEHSTEVLFKEMKRPPRHSRVMV